MCWDSYWGRLRENGSQSGCVCIIIQKLPQPRVCVAPEVEAFTSKAGGPGEPVCAEPWDTPPDMYSHSLRSPVGPDQTAAKALNGCAEHSQRYLNLKTTLSLLFILDSWV